MRLPALALTIATLLAPAAPAFARSERTLAYERDQAWPAAVRFIRVDERLKIIEKDADAGYVLFELVEEKRTFRGSLEIINVEKDGRPEISFVVQIEDRPSYLEDAMLERLERKLHVELGSPSPTPTHHEAPKDGDKDKTADKDRDKAKDEPSGARGGDKDRTPPRDPIPELPHDTLSPTP